MTLVPRTSSAVAITSATLLCCLFTAARPQPSPVPSVDRLYDKCVRTLQMEIERLRNQSLTDEKRRELAEVSQAECLHPNAPPGFAALTGELNADLANLAKAYLNHQITSAQYTWYVHLATAQFVNLSRQSTQSSAYTPVSAMSPPPDVPPVLERKMRDLRFDAARDLLLESMNMPLDLSCSGAPRPWMARPLAVRHYKDGDQGDKEILVQKILPRKPGCAVTYIVDFIFRDPTSQGSPAVMHATLLLPSSSDFSEAGSPVAEFRVPWTAPSTPMAQVQHGLVNYKNVVLVVHTMDSIGQESERSAATRIKWPPPPPGPNR
jgi:hypothetical protein